MKLISPSTAGSYNQAYISVGSGSFKKYEPVTITQNTGGIDAFGNNEKWIITYVDGRSHQIHSDWALYA